MSDRGLGELEKLTPGEVLLVFRRRQGLSQSAMAQELGVSLARYSLWERDLAHPHDTASLGILEPHEKCFLYRRRCKMTQAQVARELGRCRWWVNQMEQGLVPCDELIEYWEC